MHRSKITVSAYLTLAIPFTISTITQPLLGAVDIAVLGYLDDASFMGGVAIGAVIFNTIYWLFGFLRVSTSGMSAQSLSSGREGDRFYSYLRSAVIALVIGFMVLILQYPIRILALAIYKLPGDIGHYFTQYFNILIYGVPFVLLDYVNLGWLMGRKHIKETMVLQISKNLLNIVLDIIFVFVFRMEIFGVALATLVSQVYGCLTGLALLSRKLEFHQFKTYVSNIFNRKAIEKILRVNTDLFIRTICLLVMTNVFMAQSSALGKNILAANAVLFQIQYLMAYVYDGFANASSVLAGQAQGARNEKELRRVFTLANWSCWGIGILITGIVLIFAEPLINVFTTIEVVRSLAMEYVIWLQVYPAVIGIGLIYYGIYSGCTYTSGIRNSMILALVLFAVGYVGLMPRYGNHGLWIAFLLFSLGRSAFLLLYRRKVLTM